MLVKAKADVNLGDKIGQTPLLMAAKNGHEHIVRLLLETGRINANARDSRGSEALECAAATGNEAIAQLLLDLGQVSRLSRPLFLDAERGYEALVELFIETGKGDIDARYGPNDWDPTALSVAAQKGHFAIVHLLLGTGQVNTETMSSNGRTPLFWAAVNGHLEVVGLLLMYAAEFEVEDLHGRTPLCMAAENGHERIVKLFIEEKLKVELEKCIGIDLLEAAKEGYASVGKLMFGAGKVNVE
jgi:ankyrin repeat protein